MKDLSELTEQLSTKEGREKFAKELANDPEFSNKWESAHTPWERIKRISRNDLCPCGSGKKWKNCSCKEYHNDAVIGYTLKK